MDLTTSKYIKRVHSSSKVENTQETMRCLFGSHTRVSPCSCSWRSSGAWVCVCGNVGLWFGDYLVQQLSASPSSIRSPSLGTGRTVSFSHSWKRSLHLSSAETGQGPHRPCQDPFPPACCPGPFASPGCGFPLTFPHEFCPEVSVLRGGCPLDQASSPALVPIYRFFSPPRLLPAVPQPTWDPSYFLS